MESSQLPHFMVASIEQSKNFEKLANGQPCALGIDEAGRGPILGPMVYACAVCPLVKLEELRRFGVNDSKVLKEAKRDEALKKMIKTGEEVVAFAYQELSARFISSWMLSIQNQRTLNDISHQSAISLIRYALQKNINVKEIYVDTVGPKDTYHLLLQSEFPGIHIVVSEKADSLYPIVSAASIVAKVKRDLFCRNHQFDEDGIVKPEDGFGSGYPSDSATQKYMCENIDPIFGYSTFVRFSWKPVREAMKRGAVNCDWSEPQPVQTLFNFFAKKDAELTVEKSSLFALYICKSVYDFYELFHYTECDLQNDERFCIRPFLHLDPSGNWPKVKLVAHFYAKRRNGANQKYFEYIKPDLALSNPFEETINLSIPIDVRRNGSMHVELFLSNTDDLEGRKTPWHLGSAFQLTKYTIPQAEAFNLMSNSTSKKSTVNAKPTAHLRSIMPLNIMTDNLVLDVRTIPGEMRSLIYESEQKDAPTVYLPIFAVDDMKVRLKDLVEIKKDSEVLNLTISYQPISFGKLRFQINMRNSFAQFAQFGFGEKDVDDIKGTFSEINFYFLALTVVVATVHLLFDFLTFKNDVSFWRGRKTMVGISTRTLIWRCFSETVVFFYLMDERSSYLILIPSGIGALVEYWKLTRALKIHINMDGWRPRLTFGELSAKEKETGDFDVEGMRYVSYILIPLCISGAVYNLIYVPQRSWASWVIKCLANCVYAFGFLFMLPQLFLNYRLRSVAHLPWKAFMYKAFNTFIDDIFAFIITMPTAHRLACFRDDIVFLIYLYQRWLYPVDKTRVNEYGEAFDEEESKDEEKKKVQ
ncbi:Ribonuclease [Aphelenchoides besseyi]|nr:Ribonuclease [Aphelenchoides besseyi]